MKILIAGAWPYANGALHIGHIAALLPGDVLARYHRAKGDCVYYVSGSDCYGTPVAIRAKQEGKSPEEISGYYHASFCRCFKALGFSYDRYGKTSDPEHREFVLDFHRQLYKSPYVYEKEAPQSFCETCGAVRTDRFVEGACPVCAAPARGDQCDACGTVLNPEDLQDPVCGVCGHGITFKTTTQLFIAITRLETELRAYLAAHPHWRKNAAAFTRRYLDEGLRDRALTRDLDWGIDVPRPGYEHKRIYIWAENVLGYLSMSKALAQERGDDFAALWSEDARHYYVHGKDNIPFHTIILPSLLLTHGGDWRLPQEIISSEYLTLEGRKISTSGNWAIWAEEFAARYHPDAIRYFLLKNGPQRRDTDFSWREFVHCTNAELLGAYGNLVNRTLAFVHKYWAGEIPLGHLQPEIEAQIEALYPQAGGLIEAGRFKEALEAIFGLVRYGNKYFDDEKPWLTRREDPAACRDTLYSCVQIIANLGALLAPFLPFSTEKLRQWLGVDAGWSVKRIAPGHVIPQPEILFQRLDKSVIDDELAALKDAQTL